MEYNITGHTGLTGLLGSPVAHSISPMMHNESFRYLNLDYVYLCFDVNTDNLEEAVTGLKTLGVKGFNCTMPVKNKMFELIDEASPAAEIIGAVNTVLNDNGKLIGYNTDGIGYMKAVQDAGHNIIGKKMTLMGAGGAATAVCTQAALDGVSDINVFSLKDQFYPRAEQLVERINKNTNCKVTLYDLDDKNALYESISSSDILTNGTPVGMAPNTDACIIEDESIFRPELIVSDVIYNPEETKLMKMAKSHNCPVFNGLFMLLYQGAEAFKIWTGEDMPIELIKSKYFVR
ncbi:MAG: shikimate dehydrogenase [Lachnospiraceae bacterium]|nr:shikimate dehydrogenase [Lachnospiraceae bacterium]MDE6253806.1 shikimate dehydrogenase [Lachnospiraceae bacterium]